MEHFFVLIYSFYADILDKLSSTFIRFGDGVSSAVSIGSILVSAIVIGFVVNLYWKGAKA